MKFIVVLSPGSNWANIREMIRSGLIPGFSFYQLHQAKPGAAMIVKQGRKPWQDWKAKLR
jgi:hypothetical protein